MLKKSVIALVLVSAMMVSACKVNVDTNISVETSYKDNTATASDESSSEADPAANSANVVCKWRDQALKEVPEYEWYATEDGPSDSQVMFYTDAKVTDFKFLHLNNVDYADGKLTFDEIEAFSVPELNPDKGLLVNIFFVGDLPEYAISYVDQDGTTKKFIITVSGEDGSILMNEC